MWKPRDKGSIAALAAFNCVQGRFLSSYRTHSSESIPARGVVAWDTSLPCPTAGAAGQHSGKRLHLKSERSNLKPVELSVGNGVHRNMKFSQAKWGILLCAFVMTATLGVAAQDPPAAQPKAPAQSPAQSDEPTRLTIEVTAGDKAEPVENASVYVKYIEQHTIKKDKKVELNVKTNREGAAHVPDAPLGRALIQVIADGWKTYGRWYDITDPHQIIKIRLERPPKWY
jgi:hypothetical protein